MTREAFEHEVQQLVGLQLKQVRYYESYGDWPSWHTEPDFDSVQQGLDFIGDDASYFITWDASFWNYGLRVRSGSMVNFLSAGQFEDVSASSRWSGLRGQQVRAAQFMWEPIPLAEEGAVYPQHLVLTFEAGDQVYLSAAMPQGVQAPLFGMSDHIVVLFDQELARHYLLGME
ncbi:hypothetical protein [Deinococcus hohokamensis]|uniref:Uncharacterized protein n=1 Tax=Deinococcus hohokamensis TaxID=309883 RepID=A0ABV9IBS0_9DEIO